MPKVSRAGKFRKASKEAQKPIEGDAQNKTTSNLSRGQRKRLAKREQYLKREKMILSTLKLKQEEEQKQRLDGLDALKEALTTVDTTSADTSTSSTSNSLKGKKNLAAREMQHMNLVLEHPAFQSNPFEAIQQHLRNSLSGQAKEQEIKSLERQKEDKKKQDLKKKLKKERIQAAGGKHRKKFHAARKT